ncbi:hypothetical protein [Roseateles violae]|uniref:Lipoprotein n=1 Tax=Roseateles violae TaxID=3058042 RepID=A0ABT8DW89_9BURK|nr:hypothetical protein [Pelomonas sp. PFR6]MDN3922525.1 hypothetical protein [Pelomonas sp. PFR6]
MTFPRPKSEDAQLSTGEEMKKYVVLAICSPMLLACASIDSIQSDAPGDGLVYYMPNKDFIVTVVNNDSGVSASIESSAAYPDLSQPYVLNFNRNWIGKNEIKVGVGASGLLTSAKSTTTSGISDVLKNLAASFGAAAAMTDPTKEGPCPKGSFTYVVQLKSRVEKDRKLACGLSVVFEPLRWPAETESKPVTKDELSKGRQGTGIFYRQEEPYLVQVVSTSEPSKISASAIKFSPSQATTRFLPIAKTLFASNEAEFAFTDGMPTKYDQNADGELIGLLKLPADVIGAYFEAMGKIFTSFKGKDEGQASVLAAETQLELAKIKYAACAKAIQAKDDKLILSLECGK